VWSLLGFLGGVIFFPPRHWSCFVAPVVKMMIVVLYRAGG
jgi:hypothetical protein